MSDAPEDQKGAPKRLTLAVGGAGVGIGVLLLVHLREWVFLCDDAYIAFRYAQNLGLHGALVYNLAPEPAVEGYTNFLFVLALALGEAVGIGSPTLAPVLTAAASLSGLALVIALASELRRRYVARPGGETPTVLAPIDLVPAALLAVTPEFVVWASSGLETSLATALVLGSSWAWLRGRLELAAGLAAAAGLVRADALLWIAAFGLAWLAVEGGGRFQGRAGPNLKKIPWKRVVSATAIFALPLLAHFVFRRVYYGAWWPNTFAIKRHGALLRDTWGVDYVGTWARNMHLVYLVPLLLFIRPRHLLVLVPTAVTLAYAYYVGGDFMAYSRFLLPATVGVALLVGWLLAEASVLLRRMKLHAEVATVLGFVLVVGQAATLPGRIASDRAKPWIDGRWEGVMGMDQFAKVRVAAGREFHELVPADVLVSVGAAGAMPYASGLPTFDAYGLVDPGVLEVAQPDRSKHARPGHQLHAPMSYVKAKDPGLMCHAGYSGPKEPSRGLARRRGGPGYRWACVETGPIPDRRSEGGILESQFYCCLRARDRVVGPFGAEGGSR